MGILTQRFELMMTIFLGAIAILIWLSWARARAKGIPWFSFGNQPDSQRARTMARRTSVVAARQLASFPALDALTRNPDTSRRLVAHARALNPDRSLEWCTEKAIYDIERDRMAR